MPEPTLNLGVGLVGWIKSPESPGGQVCCISQEYQDSCLRKES